MIATLLHRLVSRDDSISAPLRARPVAAGPQPCVLFERLEDRQMLSSVHALAGAAGPAQPVLVAPLKVTPSAATNVVQIVVNSVSLNNAGQLVARGLIGDQPFTSIINLTTQQNPNDPPARS
jgi:hypothetical protein